MEANRRQKLSTRRPSMFNLRPKSSYIVQTALEKVMQHNTMLMSATKSQAKRSGGGLPIPKTRFTAQNKSSDFRSISSPRLKSFPAEEIRRIAISPRQEQVLPSACRQPVVLSGIQQNSGQGDSFPQSFPPLNLQHQNQSMSQQYLSQAPVNIQKHSEVLIPSSIQRSPDGQTHRPFVPNIPQREPQRMMNNPFPIAAEANTQSEDAKAAVELQTQQPNYSVNSKGVSEKLECEKQPVGGRSAALHRLMHLSRQNEQQSSQQPMFMLPNPEKHVLLSQNPVQPNFNMNHQYPLPHTAPQGVYHDVHEPHHPGNGTMTSPQDLMAHQIHQRLHQNQFNGYIHQQPLPEAVSKPIWSQPDPFNGQNHHQHCQHTAKHRPTHRHQSAQHQQQQYHEYPPLRSFHKQEDKKKNPIPFTPAMIRDQELLVATMRQQGINEEIMKRQFDALLNEQRRQLMYRQQLEQAEEVIEETKQQPGKKTNKFDDGKPEWMMHITPPRIPYALVEKMKNSQKQQDEKVVRFDDNQTKQRQRMQGDQTNRHQNTMNIPYPNQWQQQVVDSSHQHSHCHQSMYNNPRQYPVQQQQSHSMSKNIQNNGLQSMETVMEVTEALSNYENHPGLEYLANLNKKERKIHLNGVQDPDDALMKSLPYRPAGELTQEVKKGPSANGLENQRNPNNPQPAPVLHLKHFNEPDQEYPRRKVNFAVNNCHVVPAERENETMANAMIRDYQQYSPAFQNSGVFGNTRYQNPFQAQVRLQAQGRAAGSHHHQLPYNLIRSNSLPCDMYSMQHRLTPINEFYPSPENNSNDHQCQSVPPQGHVGVIEQQNPNVQVEKNCCVPDQSLEPRIIGGIKYFARKPDYTANVSPPEALISNRFSSTLTAFH